MHQTIVDWFCLINSPKIGPKTFWSLLRGYGTAEESLKHIQNRFPQKEAEKILGSFKGKIIIASDNNFPKELRRSTSCPPMLFYYGNENLLKNTKIAIIGARNSSLNGKSMAYQISRDLSNYFTIVSGLARGIDTSAHLGALKNNMNTIAILPFSFNNVYPKENQKLFDQIKEWGLVITEVPPHKNPDQGMFHARNRIISLLSRGMIVIEAALKSGSLATAKIALDIGTEVMAVPGSPTDPRSRGCNLLIKNGAPLIESYLDVLDIIKPDINNNIDNNSQLKFENNEIECSISDSIDIKEKILSLLSDSPTPIDIIQMTLNIPMKDLLYYISELEIMGAITKCSTNEIVLRKIYE